MDNIGLEETTEQGDRSLDFLRTIDVQDEKPLADAQWMIRGELIAVSLFIDNEALDSKGREVCVNIEMNPVGSDETTSCPIRLWYEEAGNMSSLRIVPNEEALHAMGFQFFESFSYDEGKSLQNWDEVLERLMRYLAFLEAVTKQKESILDLLNEFGEEG